MMGDCTEERFLKDVAKHEMIVVRDNGASRHLRFQTPGTYCMHFDLITWPGYLCYTGDCSATNGPRKDRDMDIVERLKAVESEVDGDARRAIHDAWHDLLWMRDGVALSRRAVEVAEAGKVVDLLDLLRECAPHVFSAAEAEHLLDGFRPQRRPLDDLADRVRDALGPNVKVSTLPHAQGAD